MTAMDSRDLDALEAQSYRHMSAGTAAFCRCGADDEITCRENIDDWRRLRLRPHVLRDITAIDTSVTILGHTHTTPIMVAPMGRHRLFHPDGELATARGAAAAGACFVLATNATATLEDVADQRRSSPQWFQLYLPPRRDGVEALIARLEQAAYQTIVLTVDQPVAGHSPRAARNPIPERDDIRHVNLPGQPIARTNYDPSLAAQVNYPATFADLEWLVRRTSMSVAVKGILRADDAARCIDAGAKAVIVSNHGGRHLDTTVTTATALPEVVDAVGQQAPVLVDGGIRRGTDILKAMALGASAVLIGRPVLWGLSVYGADGVANVLASLHNDLVRAMALSGAASVETLGPDLVART